MSDIELEIQVKISNLEQVKELREELEKIKELKKEIQKLEKDDNDTSPLDFPDHKPDPRPRPKFPDDIWMKADEENILAETNFEI